MDLNLVGLFVDIAESASLSAAARRAGVTRSHVSQRLRALERELGVQLMRRTTRRLELTEAGQAVYEHGVRLRQEVESVRSSVGALGSDTVGTIRVSVPTGYGRLIVAPLLLAFQQEYGRIALSVRFSNRVDDLVAAQIDVALKVASNLPADQVAREIGLVRWRLCAAPRYLEGRPAVLDPADLDGHDFVCPPTAGRRLTLQVGSATIVTTSTRLQSEDFGFLVQAVEAGLGIGVLPHYMVDGPLADGSLIALLPALEVGNPGARLYLLTTRNPYPTPAQRALVDFLMKALRPRA